MATKINSKSPTIRRISESSFLPPSPPRAASLPESRTRLTIPTPVREAQELSSSPSADYTATPLETDLFEWHFTLRGPPRSVYAEGIYHGRIVLPPAYPLKPPSFRFMTPSGRFEANREICLSISGHHEETWQPAWGLRTALVALRSFMETDPGGQLGGLETTDAVRRRLAKESHAFRCPACARTNAEIMAECEEAAREHEGEGAAGSKEVEVPSELKMGFRDEMEKAKAKAQTGATDVDAESAELAEGFVQTAPLNAPAMGSGSGSGSGSAVKVSAPGATATDSSLRARPGQGVPQPTRTVPLPNPNPQPQPQLQQLRQAGVSNDGVPVWVDRLILVVGVLLATMLLKIFLA